MKTFNLNRILATFSVVSFLFLATACGGDAQKSKSEAETDKTKIEKVDETANDAHKGHDHGHEGHDHSSHEGHNHGHEGHDHGEAEEAADTTQAE